MIRRHMMALRLGLIVADGASATAVFLLVSIIRFGDGAGLATWDRLGIDVRLAAILFGIAWVAMGCDHIGPASNRQVLSRIGSGPAPGQRP